MREPEHFETLANLENRIAVLKDETSKKPGDGFGKSTLLFRGQANADWPLATTLERNAPSVLTAVEYYRWVTVAQPQIETFTGKSWEMPSLDNIARDLSTFDGLGRVGVVPAYSYLAYLRHHGFPSPLLDWTKSLYIALYFACQPPVSARIAVYAFQEIGSGAKITSSGQALIRGLGPHIKSHPRHFLQQGQYTIAVRFDDAIWRFASHEQAMQTSGAGQDDTWKFTLPVSEIPAILNQLDDYNINAYSLFGDEEALVRTVALRTMPGR